MPETNHSTAHGEEVKAIDQSRESLLFILERYFHPETVCSNPGTSCRRIEDTIRFLTRNFAREELRMMETGYSRLAFHQRDHEAILRTLETMRQELACSDYDNNTFAGFLLQWATRHADEYDQPFCQFLQDRKQSDPTDSDL